MHGTDGLWWGRGERVSIVDVPVLTFRRPAPHLASPDPNARDRELAYRLLVPLLAALNLVLGLLVLALSHHSSSWKAGILIVSGGLLCAIGGWLAGATWLRCYWHSRMERQMRLWAGVVDAVTGWEEEVGVAPDAALKLKQRLDGLVSRF